jgi:hypothetical protein
MRIGYGYRAMGIGYRVVGIGCIPLPRSSGAVGSETASDFVILLFVHTLEESVWKWASFFVSGFKRGHLRRDWRQAQRPCDSYSYSIALDSLLYISIQNSHILISYANYCESRFIVDIDFIHLQCVTSTMV